MQGREAETEDVGAAPRPFFRDVLLLLTAKANNFAKLFLSLHAKACENGLHLSKEQALCIRFAPSLHPLEQ